MPALESSLSFRYPDSKNQLDLPVIKLVLNAHGLPLYEINTKDGWHYVDFAEAVELSFLQNHCGLEALRAVVQDKARYPMKVFVAEPSKIEATKKDVAYVTVAQSGITVILSENKSTEIGSKVAASKKPNIELSGNVSLEEFRNAVTAMLNKNPSTIVITVEGGVSRERAGSVLREVSKLALLHMPGDLQNSWCAINVHVVAGPGLVAARHYQSNWKNGDKRCAISLGLIQKPVVLPGGEIYDESLINKWLLTGAKIHPTTKEPLSPEHIEPLYNLDYNKLKGEQSHCAVTGEEEVAPISTRAVIPAVFEKLFCTVMLRAQQQNKSQLLAACLALVNRSKNSPLLAVELCAAHWLGQAVDNDDDASVCAFFDWFLQAQTAWSLTGQQQVKWLTAGEEFPVLNKALTGNKAKVVAAYCQGLVRLKLNPEDLATLLEAKDYDGNSGLYTVFWLSYTEAMEAYCEGLGKLQSQLGKQALVALLQGKDANDLPGWFNAALNKASNILGVYSAGLQALMPDVASRQAFLEISAAQPGGLGATEQKILASILELAEKNQNVSPQAQHTRARPRWQVLGHEESGEGNRAGPVKQRRKQWETMLMKQTALLTAGLLLVGAFTRYLEGGVSPNPRAGAGQSNDLPPAGNPLAR